MLVWLSRISPYYVEIVQSMIDVNVCKKKQLLTMYSSQSNVIDNMKSKERPQLYHDLILMILYLLLFNILSN